VLSGGSVRGWQAIARDSRGQAGVDFSSNANNLTLFTSKYSGVKAFGTAIDSYTDNLYRSGRLYANGNSLAVFQPTFDTFTSHYERDGFCQISGRWYAVNPPRTPDLGANGLDDDAQFGADDIGERETLPPFPGEVDSIRVSVRLENAKNRLVRQASVEYASP